MMGDRGVEGGVGGGGRGGDRDKEKQIARLSVQLTCGWERSG